MVEYRPFLNADPPRLVRLWQACGLGRGAADGFTSDALELLVFSQPYFDPQGLVVACEAGEVIGFAHAGFGVREDETALDFETGVLCAILVHPEHRRRGIGRELLSRAEAYLEQAGAKDIHAGPAPRRDPFYVGLYGGSEPAGFLESDADAGPFFRALGYEPAERYAHYERNTDERFDPVHFRMIGVRRKMQLAVLHESEHATWWWLTRFGRLDALRFALVPKQHGPPAAAVTAVGLDLYLHKWRERAFGLTDLVTQEAERRKGYGQVLLLEVIRRLRQEMMTRVQGVVPEANPAAMQLLEATGFERVDTGVVYRREA